MRKTMLKYECCKSIMKANIFVKLLENSDNRNSSILYRDNGHAGRAEYQAPESRSLTQVYKNVHCCHWLPKELSNKGYQTYQRVENP